MTAWEVTLRCMSSSRTDILELPLTTSASGTNDLILSRGTLSLCPTPQVNARHSVVIGRICAPILTFETYEPETSIEPGPIDGGDFEYHQLNLPRSSPESGRYHILLRNGDTISYDSHGLKIAIHVQRTPLEPAPDLDTQTETPPQSSSTMSGAPHQGQTLSVTTSHETVATEPISQPPAQDSETDVDDDDDDDDDLDTPATAPAMPTPVIARVRAQRLDDTAIAERDRMMMAMATPSSAARTYGKERPKRKISAARPDIYDVEDEKPTKRTKRTGRLPKVARSGNDTPVDELEDEIAVAPSRTQRRVPLHDALSSPASRAHPKKVVFSGYTAPRPLAAFLKRADVEVVGAATSRMNYICVVPSTPLKTTPKVLRCLIAKKPLVTEDWLSASKQAGSLLDVDSYIHQDVVESDRKELFSGKILFFTRAAKTSFGVRGWDDISQIAKDVGCMSIESGSATAGHEITPKDRVVFFGVDHTDEDAAALIRDHGYVVYTKSTLSKAIVDAHFAPDESRISVDS